MRFLKLLSVILVFQSAFSSMEAQQSPQVPGKNQVDVSLIRNEDYSMTWYALKDTAKIEMAKIDTKILKTGTRVNVTTTIKMKNMPDWTDETAVTFPGLAPVKHSSFNTQRDMLLDFGKENKVTGYYLDKVQNKKTEISEKTNGKFFDSNFYPQLIRWLPLKENYTVEIAIFDYNPKSAIGIIKAYITGTTKGTLNNKAVWMVSVTDDISEKKAISTYYIDAETRDVLKQEIDLGTRKMVMERL
ncbi:hypothetical protein SD427_11330 [Chryseobacterium sp. JJR-5R]|uniref:DUF3108 domain-containing protein n=1 Tax=Chryseobacterium sp. JJR-5R TaxID=3093923 RepID=UPI002A7637CD|nr:hypothetical protein [Chryseobacterium sp. JJR-5R]WPO81355.1 hypothetical protein SD427_11330 [Chryseobacterium sp. JJR-5R]